MVRLGKETNHISRFIKVKFWPGTLLILHAVRISKNNNITSDLPALRAGKPLDRVKRILTKGVGLPAPGYQLQPKAPKLNQHHPYL